MIKQLLTGVAFLAAASTANAGIITQTFWFGNDISSGTDELAITDVSGANIEELELNWGPKAFAFDQFDTLGGTRVLNSVTLTLTGVSTGWIEGTNAGTNPADLTLELGAELSVSAGAVDLVTVFPLYSNTFTSVGPGATVGSGAISTNADNTKVYSTSSTGVDAFIYSTFIGSGLYSVDVEALGYFNATGGGSGTVSRLNTSKGALEIVYNYTDLTVPVPEPTNLAIISFLLLAMSRLRKRA